LVRLIHINGASSFFFLIYIHIIKSLVNSSWKFKFVWFSGIIIFLLSILVAFVGYVLPWGQISFWAATVITNLLSIIPILGKILVEWIWGRFSVSYPTLNRFFSFHFLFPFIIIFFIFIHIYFLHINGSNNTISSPLNLDKISFDPFFSIKDILGVIFFLFLFLFLILINPYYSVDSENFIEANPIVTPIHIKPEWYFLFAYAILRAIPNKIGGVIILLIRILILYLKSFQNKNSKIKFNFIKKINLIFFFWSFIILTFLGGKNVDFPFEISSKLFTLLYFLFILII
jgi:ubiquinol-cytochrome c reductase cytochrome b subunit